MKKQKTENLTTNKGITLIALVITIIVMLILVAVTISMAVNGGLFGYAKKATGEMENAINEEQELASGAIKVDGEWYSSIDEYLNKRDLPEGLKVGDYVNYTPDDGVYIVSDENTGYGSSKGYYEFKTEDLEWRVLSINEVTGKIELISATEGQELILSDSNGYNHGVDILHDLCETLYSKTKDGEKIATARSINIEDINKKTTYDYTTYTDYGRVEKISGQYPNIYIAELGSTENGLEETSDLLEESERAEQGIVNSEGITEYHKYIYNSVGELYVTNTYYSYNPESENYLKNMGINTAPKGLINIGTEYWVASRCLKYVRWCSEFGIRCVFADGTVAFRYLLYSDTAANPQSGTCGVRPVISLENYEAITKDTTKSTQSKVYWDVKF